MNRKFINAFFAAALLLGSATVFSSCKDTNEDLKTDVENDINHFKQTIQDKIDALKGCSCDLSKLDDLEKRVQGLENASDALVAALNQELAAIEEQAAVTVTSLQLQSVENPVFGSISLPLDIKSNMLLTYYGAIDATFPNVKASDNVGVVLGALPADVTAETISGKVSAYTTDSKGNKIENYIGTVYATVNPASVNVSKVKFSLVNSQDKAYGGIELEDVKASDKVLEFGLGSRADNGFYEATAKAGDLDAIKYEIVDGLAEAVKDALKDHTKADAKNLLQLIVAQLRKNSFPALGVKAAYSWSEVNKYEIVKGDDGVWTTSPFVNISTTEKKDSVYSEYAIAAAAFKPLSFNFLKGESFDKLPTLPDLGNFDIADYFTFEINTDNIGSININVNFSETKVTVEIPGIKIYKTNEAGQYVNEQGDVIDKDELETKGVLLGQSEPKTVEAEGLSDVANAINKQLNDETTGVDAQVKKVVDNLANQIETQLKNNFQKINDKIAGATDKVQPWMDRANSVINRINNLLKNPNHFLQVCALYENGDKIGRMSNTSAAPTYFPGGGASSLGVILTTYTLETVCPAYMKYYAVYKLDGANKTKVAAAVIPGTTSRINIGGLTDGAKYEVDYQALDYHGITSTQKFYFEIGK